MLLWRLDAKEYGADVAAAAAVNDAKHIEPARAWPAVSELATRGFCVAVVTGEGDDWGFALSCTWDRALQIWDLSMPEESVRPAVTLRLDRSPVALAMAPGRKADLNGQAATATVVLGDDDGGLHFLEA